MNMDGNRHLKRQVRTDGQTHRSADVLTYIRTDALTYIRADVLTYRRTTAHRWGTKPRPP
ncbi:hypothetical protein [Bacteroides stercoris]|uniref:Uncharacterized protein n=2 Tax=Bacteroidales TaxID=171549 RepID=A0A7J5LLS9_BACSE|nr:hypothetical protein [Bacteroides stercoris]KAB5317821.1 hypothetical protein F9949_10850 [Bacteroides stercoris]KAB5326943.1 hypothetical protein F9950_10940 [Bacteroides stercoris]KAB5333720.1 hypothetical protein F9956_10170 [Bacteroides stercoris]KAB5333803.1 hypothetical protein F9944_10770 [Bacteroides stercoris]